MNGIETPPTGIRENLQNDAFSGSIPLAGTIWQRKIRLQLKERIENKIK
jgi:hypothetical protein